VNGEICQGWQLAVREGGVPGGHEGICHSYGMALPTHLTYISWQTKIMNLMCKVKHGWVGCMLIYRLLQMFVQTAVSDHVWASVSTESEHHACSTACFTHCMLLNHEGNVPCIAHSVLLWAWQPCCTGFGGNPAVTGLLWVLQYMCRRASSTHAAMQESKG
jgi:hypothetical protein